MATRHVRLASVLAALVATAALADHPNIARGFDVGKPFQMNGIDNVNLFNGNLTVTLPIGQRYHVNGGLSYGLTLVYSGNVWDTVDLDTLVCGGQTRSVTRTYPNRRSNAGLGWLLSLGRLFPANQYPNQESAYWQYETPDGGLHSFYGTLHDGAGSINPEPVVSYTRDGTYIRMTKGTSNRTIEFPDDTYQVFKEMDTSVSPWMPANTPTGVWRLTEIHDRFGNVINLGYSTTTDNPEIWTITDGTRTQKVYFVSPVSPHSPSPYDLVLDRVVLSVVGGTTAEWKAGYAWTTLGAGAANLDCTNNSVAWSNVPLLTSLKLPAVNSVSQVYSMAAPDGSPDYYISSAVDQRNGHLKGLQLPTRGWLEWDWTNFIFIEGSEEGKNRATAVSTRRMVAADRTTTATWTYGRKLSGSLSCVDPTDQVRHYERPEQLVVSVTSPEQVTSVHYFSTYDHTVFQCVVASDFNPSEYALPFSRGISQAVNGATRYLSEEIYTGTPPALDTVNTGNAGYRVAGGTRVRSEWVTYSYDADSGIETDRNSREAAHATYFDDDSNCGSNNSSTCYASVTRFGFDGAGHFRQASTGGNFPLDTASRGNFKTTFTRHPDLSSTGAWLLNTYTDRCTADETAERTAEITQCSALGTGAQMSQSCFDATTGFLKRTRALSGTSPAASDLIAVYTPASGNVQQEDYYGGDTQSLPDSGSDLCSVTLPINAQYSIAHTYLYGSLATSKYLTTTTHPTDPGFYSVRNTAIDANTGLVTTSADASSLTTLYDYDILGRITKVTPPGEAVTIFGYPEPTSSTKPKATVTQTSSSGDVIQATTIFDDFGRVSKEQRVLPAGTATRETDYTGSGWTQQVSEWEADPPSHFTVFSNFDAFGRARKIRTPAQTDATATTVAYFGSRAVQRTVSIGQTLSGSTVQQATATTTETYDRLGRLIKVEEPLPEGTGSTSYEHDAADRLTKVSMAVPGVTPAQPSRTFSYDGRGLLASEVHPENGTTYYKGYDARGHAGRKLVGSSYTSFDLKYDYDAAERLSTVCQLLNRVDTPANDQTQVLKQFSFATANASSNYKQGKLESATRKNYSALGTIDVTENYEYSDNAGRFTKKVTSVTGTTGLLQKYSQNYTYNDQGLFSQIDYPTCPDVTRPCATPSSMISSVSPTYQNGLLKTVPNFASAVAYGLNGMLTQIDHPGAVNDIITADAVPRPARIQFNSYDSCVSPQITLPATKQVSPGSSPGLQVTVINTPTAPTTYQWLKDGVVLAGETTSACCATAASNGTYTARLINSCGKGEASTAVAVCGTPTVSVSPPNSTYANNTPVTLTAAVSGCGLAYQWYIGDSGITSSPTGTNSSSLAVSPPSTTHYWVRVTDNVNRTANSNTVIVNVAAPLPTPGPLTALFNPLNNTVGVAWGASAGADHYELQRLDHGVWTTLTVFSTSTSYALTAGTTYVFHVRAVDSGGGSASPYTANDLATTMSFVALPSNIIVNFDHFEQIRTAINAIRGAQNSPALTWRQMLDAAGFPNSIPVPDHNAGIYAAHVLALRAAMDAALAAVQVPTSGYTDTLTSPTRISTYHITQLQLRAQ
jgi:hypothetical protein